MCHAMISTMNSLLQLPSYAHDMLNYVLVNMWVVFHGGGKAYLITLALCKSSSQHGRHDFTARAENQLVTVNQSPLHSECHIGEKWLYGTSEKWLSLAACLLVSFTKVSTNEV